MGCKCESCDCKKNNEKKLRVRFCPACKSFKIRYIHTLRNFFGVIPRIQCKDCGLEADSFPILEITQKELSKENKKLENKNKESKK